MGEARALAGPPRWVTLQVDAPTTCSAAGWDLCFGISTGGSFFEELCFDDDYCGSHYWRFQLELGNHTLRFEGETNAASWSWKLHDGKVYKPKPDNAETWHADPPPDATKGVLAHYTFHEDSLVPITTAAVVDVDFVLPAKDGFELNDGLALIGPAATVFDRGLTSTAGAFCSDLGRVHEDDPYFWAYACPEAVGPSGNELFLPITDAQCNATICSDPAVSPALQLADGLINTSTARCKAGDLVAACAVRCCSGCKANCVLTPAVGFVPQWSFGKIIAVAILFLLGCYCGKQTGVADCFDSDGRGLCGTAVFVCLALYACLYMMDLVLEDETSPFWGEEDIGVMSFVRLLLLGICACTTVCSTAVLTATMSSLPLCVIPCRKRKKENVGGPSLHDWPAATPRVPHLPQHSPVKTPQQILTLPLEQLHTELATAQAVYRRLISQGSTSTSQLVESTEVKATIRAIEERLAAQSVQEGVPPMRVKTKPTFANSAYRQAYENAPRAVETTLGMLFTDVQVLIDCYCRQHGCASRQTQQLAQDLTARLLAQNQGADSDGIAKAAMLVWTSNLRLGGGGQNLHRATLFLMLNDTIRQAGHPQATPQPAIVAAARIARCINELCVLPRPPPGQYYPADNIRRVFRGGGFDPHHRAFYDSFNSHRDVEFGAAAFRIPQYWATSLSEDVAKRFMRANSGPGGLQSVLWTISMAADEPMWNAALVESSHFVGEEEYLFVPFSTFVVLEVCWGAGTHSQPHRIELLARCDNRKESGNLPTAPWA